MVACLVALSALPVHAAKVAFRLTVKDGVLQQYYDSPDSFPICREKLGYISFSTAVDPLIRSDGERLFLTTEATAEIFKGAGTGYAFTGEETVDAIQSYENKGFKVAYVILYHEDWLYLGGDGGPYSEDIRILSPQELADVRAAIAASNLQSKNTVKIIQLLGARVGSHRGDSWTQIVDNPALLEHLKNFDGVGTECHIGDWQTSISDGPETLDAMAQITQWCVQNNRIGFVFMGGAEGSYTQLASMRATYNYLWDAMTVLGVEKDRTDLLYFRQGARPGTHLPESSASLTFQVAELIGNVENPLDNVPAGPTSGLVAHWPLDEGSGTVAADASGYGFDGTLLNGVTWGSDATRDSYVVFDGTDDRIETTFTYALASTNDFTWAWWASQQSAAGVDDGAIMVGNRYGNTGAETYEFIKLMPTKGAFANTDSTGSIEDYDYSDIPKNEWHHYAMVKSGTSYQWYVDGVAQGSPVTIGYNETSPIPFRIGGDDDGSGTKVNEHFEGCIDDVVLYREALTPSEINDVINGIYLPVVTLTTLATPVDQATASAWSDGLAPHSGAGYVIPDTGNVKGESGTTTFPGNSLTVEAGGKFQVRSLASSSQITTVNNLILEGGAGGSYALLAAGTGNDETNVLDGNLTNSGASQLLTYGAPYNRSLKILSQISGDGTLQVVGAGAIIDNAANTFDGLWQVESGATLTFNNGEAVGPADVEVLGGGALTVSGAWTAGSSLTVADAASTVVNFGANTWLVSDLVFGGSAVAEGSYTAAQLNALGANAVFSGSGTLIVNSGGTLSDTLYSNAADAGVKEDGSIENLTSATAQVGTGGSNPWVDRAIVYVFQLPDLGVVDNPFLSSSFSFNVTLNESVKNSDLYGLGRRSAATVLGSDYYGQTATADPTDATRIQASILTSDTVTGVITAENSALTDYLNAQYDGGNGIGQYVFLRLNSATAKTGINRATVTMSEGGVAGPPDTRPQLSFTAINYSGTTPPEPPVLEIGMSSGDTEFTWTGSGFKVQSCTSLTNGIWIDVPGGDTPPVIVSPTNPEAFFRLIEQ